MKKPYFTVDKYTHRAYLQDGRVVEIDKIVHQNWPIIQIKPAFMVSSACADETYVGQEEFTAAYNALLSSVQEVGTILGIANSVAPSPSTPKRASSRHARTASQTLS
ncbi:hypothetical protein [Hymenobacter sp. YC55]|uniref:hypothetical protein n=1 Tax=Hymenobacter sp. YC55 TaxID=3034019 RepID=UPI0023F77DD6|nr:hypothetical protein [Hymenobacter sp. YC55]MDF7810736.1 hypothetical protein [Hymenobacter sp. YC55]